VQIISTTSKPNNTANTKQFKATSNDPTFINLCKLMLAITLLTAVCVGLSQNLQQFAAIGLLLVLSVISLVSTELTLPLALAYLPIGMRFNLGGASSSLLISFWLFDLVCLKNAIWLIQHRYWRRFKLQFSIATFLILFMVALFISALLSINLSLSLRKLYDLGQYLAIFLALLSSKWRNPKLSLHLLLQTLLLSGACTALLGVIQFYSQFAWPSPYAARDYYLEHTSAMFEGTRSFDILKTGLDNWVLINGPLRAFGSLLTPAGLGQYLLMAIVVLVVYVPLCQFRQSPSSPSGQSSTPRLNWVLVWLASELLLLAIFFTYARASWFVVMAIGATATILWLRQRRQLHWPSRTKLLIGIAALLVPLGLNLLGFSLYHYKFTDPLATSNPSLSQPTTTRTKIAQTSPKITTAIGNSLHNWLSLDLGLDLSLALQNSSQITQTVLPTPTPAVSLESNPNFVKNQQQPLVRLMEIFNLQDHSTQDRISAWRYGFHTFSKRPIFGRGPGTFGLGGLAEITNIPQQVSPEVEQASVQAHNMYLNFLVENGVVGLALYLWLIGYTIYRLIQLRPHSTAALATKLILILWLVAFSCDEFFDNLFLYTKNGALLFVVLGLAAILTTSKTTTASRYSPTQPNS
jgi:O-antigen ligase